MQQHSDGMFVTVKKIVFVFKKIPASGWSKGDWTERLSFFFCSWSRTVRSATWASRTSNCRCWCTFRTLCCSPASSTRLTSTSEVRAKPSVLLRPLPRPRPPRRFSKPQTFLSWSAQNPQKESSRWVDTHKKKKNTPLKKLTSKILRWLLDRCLVSSKKKKTNGKFIFCFLQFSVSSEFMSLWQQEKV